ncbi:MAG: NAD(P)-binding domain-containing protein [Acidobacteriota bacterium]
MTEVLVIGAGPYGTAVAHELWRRGVECVAVGEPFALWHNHTLDNMRLRSDCQASEIYTHDGRYSFAQYLQQRDLDKSPERDSVKAFRGYLREVVDRLPFDLLRQRVDHLERNNGSFRATLSDDTEIEAKAVVVATGLGSHQHTPRGLRSLPAERLLHSWDTQEIQRLEGKSVLVIGAGQSAAESVASLRGSNRVTWALRHRPFFCREPLRVPTPVFKTLMFFSRGLYQLPPPLLRTVSKPIFKTTITPSLKEVFNDHAVQKVFEDSKDLSLRETSRGLYCGAAGELVDTVVTATGFRFSMRGLPFFSQGLVDELGGEESAPMLGADFQTKAPGLYMVGGIAEPTFGPAMRFILGSRYTAKRLGAELAGLARQRAA